MSLCESSTNNADRLVVRQVRHDDQATRIRLSKQQEPLFAMGMVGVVDGQRKRVGERCGGLIERDAVLGGIAVSLFRVGPKRSPSAVKCTC